MPAASVIISILNRLWDPIQKHLGYIIKFKTKKEELLQAKERLNGRKLDVEDLERRFLLNNEGQQWLKEVKALEIRVENITKRYNEDDDANKCFGCISKKTLNSLNCCLMHSIGKDSDEEKKKIQDLFGRETSRFQNGTAILSSSSEPFDSKEEYIGIEDKLEKVDRFFSENTRGVLGVWGMGGIGKTTLLNLVKNKYSNDSRFNGTTLFVAASEDSNVLSVQKDLIRKLGLQNSECDEHDQREAIRHALKGRGFLLLLDNLWHPIDLERIGIPLHGERNGSYQRNVVLTTRKKDVCNNMKCDEAINVQKLREEDAWTLFTDNVGEILINSTPEISDLAKEIVWRCGGLPLAIKTIGRAMRNKKRIEEWERALHFLEKSCFSEIEGIDYGDGRNFMEVLRYSYKNLESDNMRECFLLCSLYCDRNIVNKDQVIRCWMGMGKIKFDSIDEAYKRGHNIIDKLLGACLLEHDDDIRVIRIHDLILDMANHELKKKSWLVCSLDKLEEKVEEANPIELIMLKIHEEKLLFSFDQQEVRARKVASVIRKLNRLTYLDLQGLELLDFPVKICDLENLEYLDISDNQIEEIPLESIFRLVNLKYLYLQGNSMFGQQGAERSIIRELRNIKVLHMHSTNFIADEAFLMDVESLGPQLKSFGIGVGSAASIERLESMQNICLEYLDIKYLKGTHELSLSQERTSSPLCHVRGLSIKQCNDLKELVIQNVFGDNTLPCLEILHLFGMKGLGTIQWSAAACKLREVSIGGCPKLVDTAWVQHLPNLANLSIWKCQKLRAVVVERGEEPISFPKLQSLGLSSLPSLESITSGSFAAPMLMDIFINRCPLLVRIGFESRSNQSKVRLYCETEWRNSLKDDDTSYFL